MAAVVGSALFLHVHLTRGYRAARTGAACAAAPTGGVAGVPGAGADPLAAQDLPTGALRLEGQAVDADHQPIAGATITLDGRRTAVTEADGAFAFDRLAEGSYRLAAEKNVLYTEDTVTLSASSEPAVLTLQPGATLVLHVLADGRRTGAITGEVANERSQSRLVATGASGACYYATIDHELLSIPCRPATTASGSTATGSFSLVCRPES